MKNIFHVKTTLNFFANLLEVLLAVRSPLKGSPVHKKIELEVILPGRPSQSLVF